MMTSPPVSIDKLGETVAAVLGGKAKSVKIALGEVTVTVAAADYLASATLLRDAAGCKFEQLLDVCGIAWCRICCQ